MTTATPDYTVTTDPEIWRPMDVPTTLAQLGKWNLDSISGGRWEVEHNSHQETTVLVLPVSNGYRVRIALHPLDFYVVERVFERGGKTFHKGTVSEVYFPELGETAYVAGMFRSHRDFGTVPATS